MRIVEQELRKSLPRTIQMPFLKSSEAPFVGFSSPVSAAARLGPKTVANPST